MWKELSNYVPNEHPQQVDVKWMVRTILDKLPAAPSVLDLGCGKGDSVDFFREQIPDCSWVGVEVNDSHEAQKRHREDAVFIDFNGIDIPLLKNSVDLIFCRQFIGRVRHPDKLLQDACRVLKNDGYFVGSASHLEPYHSLLLRNYTPYGFKEVVQDAGFLLQEIRPGIDGMTLVERTFKGRPKSYGKYFSQDSPFNVLIDAWGKEKNRSVQQILVRKLSICGHFCFICAKP